ncbi:FimV/HubP-related protein [Psychrobacter fulvigenes]|uniref:FimV/HubP-related protein n=1 Tax=Psychrobacter fulvigenes TaxID=533323 RepID=UPI001919EB44|nr:peptigoglycan-binding protein LysM [Psychrobacter fulvigenes]
MSWHLPHRLTSIHRTVSIALLYSVSSTVLLPAAHAATMGKTIITSAQHEPLAASIAVSDINAQDFAASIASPVVYQQMGLTPTASMSVRFVPTSATTGQLLINTSQPVSMPFADVVLAINDSGQRNVMPKTLLMPLGNSVPVKPSNSVIAGAKKPNLPVVSNPTAQPLAVKRGAPPPLFTEPNINAPIQTQTQTLPQNNTLETSVVSTLPTMSATALPPFKASEAASIPSTIARAPQTADSNNTLTSKADSTSINSTDSNNVSALNNTSSTSKANSTATANTLNATTNSIKKNSDTSLPTNSSVTAQEPSIPVQTPLDANTQNNTVPAVNIDNKQLDILNIQVTRQIQAKKDARKENTDKSIVSQSTPLMISAGKSDADEKPSEEKFATTSAALAAETAMQPAASSNSAAPTSSTVANNTAAAASTYTVQRNDNLWIISQQIAKQNNLDVQTVMTQIKEQNPDAFIARDADLLKADAQLKLPDYDTVPSQQSLQTAIAAQRQYYLQSHSAKAKDSNKKKPLSKTDSNTPKVASKPIPATTKPSAKDTDKPVRTTTKKLPQARFSVLAPGRDGSADGTQTKAAAATGSGLSTDILATLKSARQNTADQAKRIATTRNTLGSYAQKLQLQNQKLAELEARLKKLRNQ